MSKHSTTAKIIDILESIGELGPLSIDEIVAKTKIPYTTVYRILQTFTHFDYFEVENKKFRPSAIFANRILRGLDEHLNLSQVAYPNLQNLHHSVQETVHLGVRSGLKVLYINRIESDHLLQMNCRIGGVSDIYCTGLGKVLLAWLPPTSLNILISKLRFKKHTKNTITDKNKFLSHLEEVHSQGYAMDNEEIEENIFCLAVPVFDSINSVCAAISISQPIGRYRASRRNSYLKELWKCAEQISTEMGNKNYKHSLKKSLINGNK